MCCKDSKNKKMDWAYFETGWPLVDGSARSCTRQNSKSRKRDQLLGDLVGDGIREKLTRFAEDGIRWTMAVKTAE